MEYWNTVLEQADPHSHYVQFYKTDEPLLNRNVGRYFWEGFLRGDALIIIATPQRQESLIDHLRRMGCDIAAASAEGQLVILDARETLDLFLVNGQPDRLLFEGVLARILGFAKNRGAGSGVRAYGEMVGLLWEAGQVAAAIRVEEYWNHLIQARGMTLFCGYPIDVFGDDIASKDLQGLIDAHTHCLPAGTDEHMDQAMIQAMQEVLGTWAEGLLNKTVSMPGAEATIMWLRQNKPQHADNILSRARNYYQATARAVCTA